MCVTNLQELYLHDLVFSSHDEHIFRRFLETQKKKAFLCGERSYLLLSTPPPRTYNTTYRNDKKMKKNCIFWSTTAQQAENTIIVFLILPSIR